jgi:hypothetical protein
VSAQDAGQPQPLPGRTVQVPVVVELTGEAERQWAALRRLEAAGDGTPAARVTVDDVQAFAVATLEGSVLGQFATIRLKQR